MVKMSTDIDVLVDPQELDEVESCLQYLGYHPVGERRSDFPASAAAKEWTWVGDEGLVIDLHRRLADSPGLLPMLNAHGPTQTVEVAPAIALPTLPPEELFAYLCVHGTSSLWFRLKWAADLAALISTYAPGELHRYYRASQSWGAGRCPAVALLVIEELFGPMIPRDLQSSAARDPVARFLAKLSLRELMHTREPLDRPLGTVAMHVGQLLMDRGAFPLREFRRQFSRLMC
jgi:hypothetical protein